MRIQNWLWGRAKEILVLTEKRKFHLGVEAGKAEKGFSFPECGRHLETWPLAFRTDSNPTRAVTVTLFKKNQHPPVRSTHPVSDHLDFHPDSTISCVIWSKNQQFLQQHTGPERWLTIKRAFYVCRGSKFGSQHPCQMALNCLVPGIQTPLVSMGTCSHKHKTLK